MSAPPVIGVVYGESSLIGPDLLPAFAARLTAQGRQVGGLIQRGRVVPAGPDIMELVDVRTGDAYAISQWLGAGSTACRLDMAGLSAASAVLRREIATPPDLLIINKFAKAEAEGGGLLQELFQAVQAGIPVLTTLAPKHLTAWRQLMAEYGQMLPPRPAALEEWWETHAASAAKPWQKPHSQGN